MPLAFTRGAFIAASSMTLLCVGCKPPPTPEVEAPSKRPAALPKEIRNPRDDSVMLLVPSGQFIMGEPDDRKRVTLRAYYIDRTEVTNAQYEKFLEAVKKRGNDAPWRHPDQPKDKKRHVPAFWSNLELGRAQRHHPVVGVDWFDAYAYAKWAGKRVPTEAEWERAARGTDGRMYPWGDQPPEENFRFRANFFSTYLAADGYRYTAPVGKFASGASPVGCLNMAGNVAEWCADWFAPLPSRRRLDNPVGPATGTQRVTKGGAWNLAAASLRCYRRRPLDPLRQLSSVGFRCAKDAVAQPPAPRTE